jgi:hypothetical protein
VEEAPELQSLVLGSVRFDGGGVVVAGATAEVAPDQPRLDLIRRRLR